MRRAAWLASALLLCPTAARATWSIVAVDPATREVGIAGASCIVSSHVIAGVAPGHGAIAAQAMASFAGRDRGVSLLASGASPHAVIAAIANAEFDSFAGVDTSRLRQYGVAALGFETQPAAFTGSWTFDWQGQAQAPGVSVQGNTLVGPQVVEHALAAFTAPPPAGAASLADRLLRALEAGAAVGGDARCLPEQAALSAFLIVAKPDDPPSAPSLQLIFPADKGEWNSPLRLIAGEFAQGWRRHRGEPSELVPGDPERNPVRALRRLYDAR
jgi:uncharacterized Ntn-hydrolase superfamily protein